ncbi:MULTISPECIES: S-layer homology domain-containing protein [Paenibacillus]|uniref:SLH domain-containing protein n=1 Tax=Paenibacillus odorifer TaxID=189426 RepID=A0ABX3HA92_9BACL|nr:S-layer homology domain-containing protein [Paenibacillus odorifer]OMD45968.1 hypothetical protein BSK51_27870 [Paenibacillus odorifer]
MVKKILFQFMLFSLLYFSISAVSFASSIVIDNGDEGYEENGKWEKSGVLGYKGSGSRYTTEPGSWAKWTPKIQNPGEYEVFIYSLVNAASESNVEIEVVHENGTDLIFQNWKAGTPGSLSSSGWVSLGVYTFTEENSGYVKITKNSKDRNLYTRADAVRFEDLNPQVPEEPEVVPSATYYIDPFNGNDLNTGTNADAAWQTLEKVNSVVFQPGTKLLFKAGGYWKGQLKPQGSGSDGNPIIIDRYGTGNKPIIDGDGIIDEGVVHLFNQEYWEINNLEIINDAPEAASRYGIYIQIDNEDSENPLTADHIYVKDCYVHNVKGDNRSPHTGVGIFYYVTSADTSTFNDILIENNTVKTVDRSGIILRSPDGTFSTNVVIRSNFVEDIGGDGIVAKTSKAPLVEYNIAKDTSARANNANVAIWTWYTEDATVQYNEAYGTKRLPNNLDAHGFDSDFNNRRNIFQYNYSHDNGGGFMLIINATEGGYNDSTIVRYNISQNDKAKVIELLGDNTNAQIYNNTIYLDSLSNALMVRVSNYFGIPKSASFYNNIFYNLGSGSYEFPKVENFLFDTNIFYGMSPPVSTEEADITVINSVYGDPKLVNPGSGGMNIDFGDPNRLSGYKLQLDSSAINAGLVIENNGGIDFWGNSLYNGQPDIGAFEYHPETNSGSGNNGNGNTGSGSNIIYVTPTLPPSSKDASLYIPKDTELRKDSMKDGNKAVNVVIDSSRLARKLADLSVKDKPTLTIDIPGGHSSVAVQLPLSILYNSLKDNSETVITVKSDLGSFDFPLEILKRKEIEAVNASDTGAALIVRMDKNNTQMTQQFDQAFANQGLGRLSDIFEFKVFLKSNDKVEEIRNYGDKFITQVLKVNKAIKNTSRVTAVVYDPVSGKLKFIPSFFTVKNDQTEVVINSNTSSLYTIVQYEKVFEDMDGHWAKRDVESLAAKMVIQGTTNRLYSPDMQVTRAQFAALLVRALGLSSDFVSNAFADITSSMWYASEVNVAAKYGLVQGTGEGEFDPDSLITREQMVVMMMNAVRLIEGDGGTEVSSNIPFEDKEQISDYAYGAIGAALNEGLITGRTATTFAPQDAATRAEAAVLLKQAMQYLRLMN